MKLIHDEISRDENIQFDSAVVRRNKGAVMRLPCSASLNSLFDFFRATFWNQTNRFLAKLDFKVIARLQIKHRCVGLSNQQVSVALDGGNVAEFSATFANASLSVCSQGNSFGFKEGFIERGEIKPLSSVLLCGDLAACSYKVRL